MIIITLWSGAATDSIQILQELPFKPITSNKDMEKLNHEAKMEYESTIGRGVTVRIELYEIVVSKSDIRIRRIKEAGEEFLNNLLAVYPIGTTAKATMHARIGKKQACSFGNKHCTHSEC